MRAQAQTEIDTSSAVAKEAAGIIDFLSKDIFTFDIGENTYRFTYLNVVMIVLVLAITRASIWFVKRWLQNRVNHSKLDKGKAYAITQIVTYLVWTIAILFILDYIGIKITALLLGSTALFVGLGLGLQDTFKDFVAGFIILMERTMTVGDVVEVNNIVGRVLEVGLRTTLVQTRDDIYLIIPNQKLTSENVINWSQSKRVTRFAVDVGVAYGSDTRKVEKLLIEAAKEHSMVAKNPEPTVHFGGFGDSSLDFSLLFYSNNLFRIEKVKSDLRFAIDQKFRDNNVTIPFPQRDLWVKDWPKDKLRHGSEATDEDQQE